MPLAATDCHRADEVHRFGFSFVELLFAIAVLGIGFIMIAAVFPVGLQQTKITLNETAGAAGSRSMVARLQQVAHSTVDFQPVGPNNTRSVFSISFPYAATTAVVQADLGHQLPGIVRTLNDPRPFADGMAGALADRRRFNTWQIMADDLINLSDPRAANVVLFKRDAIATTVGAPSVTNFTPASTAQVIVINTQIANQPVYGTNDVSASAIPSVLKSTRSIFNLEARPVAVQIVYDQANQTYVASFFSVNDLDGAVMRGGYPTGSTVDAGMPTWKSVLDSAINAVTEGAFVVISDDRITAPAASRGRLNGRTFRVGNRRTDLAGVSFDLAPGYEFTTDVGADGVLFSSTAASGKPGSFKDDVIAVGLGKDDTSGRSGLAYSPTPNGGSGSPNADELVVDGTVGNHGAVALVIGRGFETSSVPPTAPSGYTGPAQDVSLYTTFVSVSQPLMVHDAALSHE